MQDLIEDVINDLAEGHIDKAEAKQRVSRIIEACKQDYWTLPSFEPPRGPICINKTDMPWPMFRTSRTSYLGPGECNEN